MREWTDEDRQRERHRAQLKWERDQTAFVAKALEEGRRKGVWIGRIQMGQDLLSVPLTSEEELTSLPVEELQARARAIEQQIRARI